MTHSTFAPNTPPVVGAPTGPYQPRVAFAGAFDPLLPQGARGSRPIWIGTDPVHTRDALQVPGITESPRSGGILASWDAMYALRIRLGWDVPLTPPAFTAPIPNAAGYVAKNLHTRARAYQPVMTSFLIARSMAINADPMRVGKTFETLAAVEALGLKHVLVLPPAIAKPGWAEQIAEYLGDECLLLSGRAGLEARWYCTVCRGRGWLGESWCEACRARNGSSYGSRLVQPVQSEALETGADLDAAQLTAAHVAGLRKAVGDAISRARFVICNYDILVTQQNSDAAGGKYEVEHLRGWSQILSSFAWDAVIADEAHMLRGRPNFRQKGKSRRDRALAVAQSARYVWALTGTPIYGKVADGWGLLDFITNGLFGRPHLAFEASYADGKHVQDPAKGIPKHWEAKGSTNELELKYRLSSYMLRRERAEIVPHMPAKTRQVQRLEARSKDKPPPRHMDAQAGIHDALRRTAAFKLPFVVEAVMAEMAEGMKSVICTYHVESTKEMYEAISKGCRTGEMAARSKLVNTKGWLIHGGVTADKRKPLADAFVQHPGAAFMVCSMGSVPGAISFKGASTVHFADLHHDPAVLLQVEDRAYEVDTKGLSIIYYVVERTVDEHVVGVVMPKMDQLERVVGDTGARDFSAVFGGKPSNESMDEIFARMCRAAEAMES